MIVFTIAYEPLRRSPRRSPSSRSASSLPRHRVQSLWPDTRQHTENLPRMLPNPDAPDVSVSSPANPLAIATTISFVLVSPSTVIILKVVSVILLSSCCRYSLLDRCIGCHETEHRRHVRVNHPRTFRCPGNVNLLAVHYKTDTRHLLHEIRCQDRLAEVIRHRLLSPLPAAVRCRCSTLSIGSKLADDTCVRHADMMLRYA